MVIEVKKKYAIIAIICIIIGIIIGVSGILLTQKNKETEQNNKEIITTTSTKTLNDDRSNENVNSSLPDKIVSELALYKNNRYGFSVQYPSNWIKGIHPANGDGIFISPQDGTIELQVSGSNNTLNHTAYNEYNCVLSKSYEYGIPGFHTFSDDWYVVTYTDGTFIYYVKGFVGKGSINTMRIKYLQSMKDQYQPVIQQLERSFNHGNFDIAH